LRLNKKAKTKNPAGTETFPTGIEIGDYFLKNCKTQRISTNN